VFVDGIELDGEIHAAILGQVRFLCL